MVANIKTFEAPSLGLQPTETGIDATVQTARRIGMFYNQAGESKTRMGQELGSAVRAAGDVAVQYAEHQEISHGAANFAKLTDNLTQNWNDRAKNADPNDPTVAAKFREDVLEPALEQYRQGFLTEGGQKFAETRIDALRNHLFEKTAADMSSLAKDAVAVNMRQTVNSLSNTAMKDPSAVSFLLKQADDLVSSKVESSPNIKGTDASKAKLELTQKSKEAIVKSAVIGAIDKTGQIPKWAYEDRFSAYIDGAEVKQFEKYAQAQQRANALTQRQLQQFDKQDTADKAHKALSDNFTNSVTFDNNGKATIKPDFYKNIMEIERGYPGAATERSKAMINWGQSEQREKRETIITNPAVKAELFDGFYRTDNPTDDVKILSAASRGDLDPHDTSILLQLGKALEEKPLKGPIFQGAMAAAKAEFGDSELGLTRYAAFQQAFLPEYLRLDKTGQLPANALNPNDPKSLISQTMEQFKLDPQQKMMGHIMKRIGAGGDISDNLLGVLQGKPAGAQTHVTLPKVEERIAGDVYPTPQGKMRWTGTGWLDPSVEWKKNSPTKK
jgi:hypothetical protein